MGIVKWNDFFGNENILMEGRNDDVFFVVPNEKDDEGNSFTKIISKNAIIEMADKLKAECK